MKKLLSALLLTLLFLGGAAQPFGGNIRGKIINGNNSPVANMRVELCQWDETKRQYTPVSFAITSNDGIFLFLNIRTGQRIVVKVNGKLYPAQPITVIDAGNPAGKPAYQDIPPIKV